MPKEAVVRVLGIGHQDSQIMGGEVQQVSQVPSHHPADHDCKDVAALAGWAGNSPATQ